jgi:predicted nucleic-acid-binding protein
MDAPTAFVDTNILVRYLTGDPPGQAAAATPFILTAEALLLTDLIVAELVYVLESVYETRREEVARVLRAVLGYPAIGVADEDLLRRAVEIYEFDRLDFAEAYLVACAERSGIGVVASFDQSIDRVRTVHRLEPE